MGAARIPEVVRGALERWGDRLAWIIADNEGNDFVFYAGIRELCERDEALADTLNSELTAQDLNTPYAHGVFLCDAGQLNEFAPYMKKQMVYCANALRHLEQAAALAQ